MSNPSLSQLDSACSATNWLCTHPTQLLQAGSATVGIGFGGYACAEASIAGNLVVAVTAAATVPFFALTAFFGMGGMACVSNRIKLSNDSKELDKAATELEKTSTHQAEEIKKLTDELSAMSAKLAELKSEKEENEKKKATEITQITALTEKLSDLQKEKLSIQKEYEAYQTKQIELLHAREQEANALKSEKKALDQSVADMSAQIKKLDEANSSAAKQNGDFQRLLDRFQKQEDGLQKKIDQLTNEKIALERLVKDLETESELQKTKIEESMNEYASLEKQLKEITAELEHPSPQMMKK